VGLPLEGAAVVIAVDPILDRFRTTVNVWGDAVGAAVMERHGLDPDDVQTPAGIAAIEASGS
ncbi:MAG: solute carrier family 1 (high affinity glutamate transporter) protein 1, partial [Myxococcota bacterium]